MTRQCSDCNEELHWIQVYDRGGSTWAGRGLAYAAVDDRPSLWTGVSSVQKGTLQAALCRQCHRVYWFALPGEQWELILSEIEAAKAAERKKAEALRGAQSVLEMAEEEGALSPPEGHQDLPHSDLNCLKCGAPMSPESESCASCGWTFLE